MSIDKDELIDLKNGIDSFIDNIKAYKRHIGFFKFDSIGGWYSIPGGYYNGSKKYNLFTIYTNPNLKGEVNISDDKYIFTIHKDSVYQLQKHDIQKINELSLWMNQNIIIRLYARFDACHVFNNIDKNLEKWKYLQLLNDLR